MLSPIPPIAGWAELGSARHVFVTRLSLGCHCATVPDVLPKVRVTSKILVVDDEPDAVELVAFNLRAAGYEVWRPHPMEQKPCGRHGNNFPT